MDERAWEQIVRHIDHLAGLRVRFAAVSDASASIAYDDSTYGVLCRWATEDFHARHVRQDELVAQVDRNLQLISESLCAVAEVRPEELDPVRLAASVSLVAVPVARTRSAIEQVEPLRAVLDRLTGKADLIASHVLTWTNIAVELRSMADDLAGFVASDLPDWRGAAAGEHQRLMGHNVAAIKGLSAVSAALAQTTDSAGVLVTQTRRIVREFVVDLLTLTVPASTAWRDGTFARWARRVAVYAVALNTTLTHLDRRLNG